MALYAGAYRATAARYARVPPETLSRWLAWTDREPYATFKAWVEEAEAAFEMRALLGIAAKINDKPEIAVTMLERKFPQRWARVVAQPNTQVNVNFSVTSALQQIEQRAQRVHDPRPPRSDRASVIDVIRAPVRTPIAIEGESPVLDQAEDTESSVERERASQSESPAEDERDYDHRNDNGREHARAR
jgi:hypothetical protein